MESSNQFNESCRQGLTAGYVFAATFVIILYMSYCLPAQLIKNRKNKTGGFKKATQKRKLPLHELKQEKSKEKRKRARQIERELPPELLERRIKINDIGWLTCRTSFAELYEATEHFSEDSVLGEGRTGTMYKATLPNGWFLLAVKKLYDSELFIRSFDLEIMMGRYSHRNIMVPISFCIEEEKNERFLVYHYMSNGRVSDWLNDTTTLGWPAVIRVALGVARGLCCLHHSLHMVHLSIGPESILLGNNFEPRISNFGMAIFIDHDPGKNIGFDKKDVYDFGTLLIEVIRGKTFGQTSNCFSNANTNGPFATYTYATNLFEDPSGFYDAVDKSLNEIEFEDEVSALLRVACDCVHPFPPKRPTMLEVYSKMSNIWERDGIFEDSSMS